jgi:hypothetical protein
VARANSDPSMENTRVLRPHSICPRWSFMFSGLVPVLSWKPC